MTKSPSGNITFLFTDIEGSTKLSQEIPDQLHEMLEKHNSIVSHAFESNNGFIFEMVGDAFCCSFENASDSVNAAVDAQINLSKEKWGDKVLKVRMGIHSGKAEWNGKKYIGYITLARASRVMSAAYGGQILISNDSYEFFNELKSGVNKNKITFRDLGERRLKDLIQPLKLFQVISEGLNEDFPQLKTLDARPNNLPIQLTSFIGRETEMNQIRSLLKQNHLLTLTGSGGTGKTRLALQITADMIDEFENGVWLVELDSLQQPKLLSNAIMQALKIPEQPRHNCNETLSEYLKEKELLLILDNCEHVISECSKLAEQLLRKSPALKILATSREPLRCHGEQTFKVLPLTIPDLKEIKTSDTLAQYESVELFVERAQLTNPKFSLTGDNVKAIAGICSKLDGIPLAIELAAVRTNALPVEKIYERLDDRFKFLTGGKRTALRRQQTLAALIDWSYDLLSEKEKLLWSRLSVFSGGWTLEAAEAICSDEIICSDEVVDLLSDLTEKSIVIFSDEKLRFRMLETIRQYGMEKLKGKNEAEKISSRHLEHFRKLAETAERKIKGKEAQQWLKVLDNESPNIEKGLKWSIKNSSIDEGMNLAGVMGYFWRMRGYKTEGVCWLKSFLQKKPGKINPAYCTIVSQMGYFLRMEGNVNKAKQYFEQCFQLSSEIEFKRGITEAINGLGLIEFEKGEYEGAEKLFQENLKIYYETNDKSGIAQTLNNMGTLALDQGDIDEAYKLYEESLAILRELGDIVGITRALNNLCTFEYERGEYSKVKEMLQENLKFNREIGNRSSLAITLNNLGTVSFYHEEYEEAINFYNESLEIHRELGEKYHIAFALINLGNVKLEQHQTDSAIKLFEESQSIGKEIDAKMQIALSMFGLGRAAIFNNQYQQARRFYNESLSLYIEIGGKKDIALNLLRLAELPDTSREPFQTAMILGFVENYFTSGHFKLSNSEQNTFDTLAMMLKKELNEDFGRYFEEGKTLPFEESIRLAMK